MFTYEIIQKKRDGQALSYNELKSFFTSYLIGKIPDYQASALLTAILSKGLNAGEAGYLTDIMMHSGTMLDLTCIGGVKIGEHSTGCVGDKVSLILAPLVASTGVKVPMISGRGLGYRGGTLDKLESIPGFKTDLGRVRFKEILKNVGCVISAPPADMAPLDRKLYSLKDVAANTDSIPFIVSSIMSKKLSEGTDGLVLDVKAGSGSFVRNVKEAKYFAAMMVEIGRGFGLKTCAAVTDMSSPLGNAVGNSLEVLEVIEMLKGNGAEDLMDVTVCLGALMLEIAGRAGTVDEGREELRENIYNGAALEIFRNMLHEQGGNPNVVDRPSLLPLSCLTVDVFSEQEGYISSIDAESVGIASMILGAGRKRAGDSIDHSAGIEMKRKVGDYVFHGDVLCTLHTSDEGMIGNAEKTFLNAVTIGQYKPDDRKLIIDVLG